jgi:hypothetical protein
LICSDIPSLGTDDLARDALTGKPGQQYSFVQVLGVRGLPIVESVEKRLRTEGRLALDDLPGMGARRDAVANLR